MNQVSGNLIESQNLNIEINTTIYDLATEATPDGPFSATFQMHESFIKPKHIGDSYRKRNFSDYQRANSKTKVLINSQTFEIRDNLKSFQHWIEELINYLTPDPDLLTQCLDITSVNSIGRSKSSNVLFESFYSLGGSLSESRNLNNMSESIYFSFSNSLDPKSEYFVEFHSEYFSLDSGHQILRSQNFEIKDNWEILNFNLYSSPEYTMIEANEIRIKSPVHEFYGIIKDVNFVSSPPSETSPNQSDNQNIKYEMSN